METPQQRDETRFAYPDQELRDLIPEFLNNRRNEIPVLEGFVAERNYDGLRRMGHTLKGICASFGFPYLGRLGRRMEEVAEARNTAEVEAIVAQMKRYVQNVQVIYEDPV